jgi:hypothetical protein
MRHFIKKSLMYTLLVIFVFTILNWFQSFYNIEPEHYKKQYESIVNNTYDYDGVIFGTSHATHSIRPKVLDESGVKFYNYSLNGSNPEFYFKWYNSFIHNTKKKPKYCIYAVDFFMFDRYWVGRRFEQDAEFFPANVFFNELLNNADFNRLNLIINRFPFLKYRSQIKQSLLLKKGSPNFNSDNYDRGYISFSVPFDSKLFEPSLKYNIDSIQVKYFKLLLKQILDDDIKIIFVMTPEYGISANEYYQMESLKIIDSISKELDIPILNYNTELSSSINKEINYFTDWGHMNHFGAQIFSNELVKEIKARMHNKDYLQ